MTRPQESVALPPHGALRGYYREPAHKARFVRALFDRTAGDYDRIEKIMSFGTGPWYRRRALARAGLATGMTALDVAAGTGLVTREAARIVGQAGRVVALDPSGGMLRQLRSALAVPAVLARGECLPIAPQSFDFLSMGYALRHLSDLRAAFAEFFRVLRPGGRVCLLEITAPAGWLARLLLRAYVRGIVPCIARLAARSPESPLLWQYYWDTIAACVPPQQVIDAMRQAGFPDARRHVELGVFSEYVGTRP